MGPHLVLQLLEKYSPANSKRRVVVMWMVAKPDLLNLFYPHIRRIVPPPQNGARDAAMIYYTGADANEVRANNETLIRPSPRESFPSVSDLTQQRI